MKGEEILGVCVCCFLVSRRNALRNLFHTCCCCCHSMNEDDEETDKEETNKEKRMGAIVNPNNNLTGNQPYCNPKEKKNAPFPFYMSLLSLVSGDLGLNLIRRMCMQRWSVQNFKFIHWPLMEQSQKVLHENLRSIEWLLKKYLLNFISFPSE